VLQSVASPTSELRAIAEIIGHYKNAYIKLRNEIDYAPYAAYNPYALVVPAPTR